MIISYERGHKNKRLTDIKDKEVEVYSYLCGEYPKLILNYKIDVQVAKYSVLAVEINSIIRLIKSTKINEVEKLLLKDQKNILLEELLKCYKEYYKLLKEKQKRSTEIDIDLNKVESKLIELEKELSKRYIDFDKYITLSPIERIHLLISQKNMLELEQFALERRRKSLERDIDEEVLIAAFEESFLDYRRYILSKCTQNISKCITLTFYNEFKRNSPGVTEIYEEILRGGCDIKYSKYEFKGIEDCRYPYDFKRPNEIPPFEWGSPDVNWKIGY